MCIRDRSTNYQLNFSIGEPVTPTIVGTNYILSQGFHQPEQLSVSAIPSNLEFEEKIEIFPNPTNGLLTVKSDFSFTQNIQFQIVNTLGQVLLNENQLLGRTSVQINIHQFPAGEYYLKLTNSDRTREQSFKILKAR